MIVDSEDDLIKEIPKTSKLIPKVLSDEEKSCSTYSDKLQLGKDTSNFVKPELSIDSEIYILKDDVIVNSEDALIVNGHSSTEDETVMKRDGLWECKICEKTFIKKYHAKCHAAIHNKKDNCYACNQCGSSFGTQDYLKNHKNRVHSKERVQCMNCGKADMSKVQYKNHKYQSKSCGVKYNKK